MKGTIVRLVEVAANAVRSARSGAGFDAVSYWQHRYSSGGTSGDGSRGVLAAFKARVVNQAVEEYGIRSAIEFGCGDGDQLSLMRYPRYTGLDVAASAVVRCIDRFSADATKSFFVYNPEAFQDRGGVFCADLALSLDVIYHIVADEMFELYMRHVCNAASRLLIVYSTDTDEVESRHVRHRAFTGWMAANEPALRLCRVIPNPHAGTGPQQSNAAFFCYERVEQSTEGASPAAPSEAGASAREFG